MQILTGPRDDENPAELTYVNLEHMDETKVSMHTSLIDGVLVVQIDTPPSIGAIRVFINDGRVWDGDPETDGETEN